MVWVQGDCLKPPSRLGKGGGRKKLEEVGAMEPDRDAWVKDSTLQLRAVFFHFPTHVLNRNETY